MMLYFILEVVDAEDNGADADVDVDAFALVLAFVEVDWSRRR